MLDPTYLLHATEPAEEIAEALHQDILSRIVERIMIRFQRGDEYILTPVDKWQMETLQEAGYLLEDIQKEIAKATPYMESEIVAAMEDAGVRAMEYDDAVYRAAGLDPAPLVQSPYLVTIMQDAFERTAGEWRNFTDISRRVVHKLFVEACDTAYMQAMSGAISPSQAVREALETIVEGGVYVKYPGGRKDTIETATARAVRTGISQASGNITDARMEEMNWDIILVSSHLGARVTEKEDYTNHYWWQGKFYSKSGKDHRFPPYSLCGFGEIQGIHGANCRHSHGPGDGVHNPFQEFDSDENRKRYELEQRQRTLERRIRNTKREVMGYRTARDNATDDAQRAKSEEKYQQKAALLQRQNQAYNKFCEETGLKKQHDRIRIAKWDRAEAAKARVAAKKYAVDNPNSVVPKEYNPMPRKTMEKKPTMQERMLSLEFKPAATIPEAEAYADGFVEKYKSKYSGNISFKGMDVEHANKVNRVLTAVYDAYDIPPHTDITVMNFRESKWKTAVDDGIAAAYQWGGNGGRLFINQKLIGTRKAADAFRKKGDDLLKTVLDGADTLLNKTGIRPAQKKYIEALVKSGRQVTAQSCDDFVEATIVHEMGHSLDSKVFRKHFKTSSNMDGFDIGVSMEKYAGGISGYAVSTKEEYIAESFASWWYGRTDALDPNLVKIFEGTMKK